MKVGDSVWYYYTANISPLPGFVTGLISETDVELAVKRFGEEGKVEQCKFIQNEQSFLRDIVNEETGEIAQVYENNFCIYLDHPNRAQLPPFVETDPEALAEVAEKEKEVQDGTPSET